MIEKHKLHNVRLDDEVWAAIKAMDCSLNQYLRSVLLASPLKEISGILEGHPLAEEYLDAVAPELASGRGKASTETWKRGPRQKGDKQR